MVATIPYNLSYPHLKVTTAQQPSGKDGGNRNRVVAGCSN